MSIVSVCFSKIWYSNNYFKFSDLAGMKTEVLHTLVGILSLPWLSVSLLKFIIIAFDIVDDDDDDVDDDDDDDDDDDEWEGEKYDDWYRLEVQPRFIPVFVDAVLLCC